MRSWYFTENLCLREKVWMSLQAIEASSTTELCFNNPIDLSCIPICCQHAHTFTKVTCETSFCPSFLFTIPLTSCWSLARMHGWRWSRRNQGAHLGTLASLKDIKDPCLTAWGDFVNGSVFALVSKEATIWILRMTSTALIKRSSVTRAIWVDLY